MSNPRSSKQWSILGVAVLCGFVSVSCVKFGANNLISSHTAYNEAVQLTMTREVLANVVRSRYMDPMQFLTVSAINAQFSVSAGGKAGAGGIGRSGTAGQVEGSVGYSSSPTITYLPQSDAAFYLSNYEQFEIGEIVGFTLAYRHSESHSDLQELSLIMSLASINGAVDIVDGTYNDLYIRRIHAIARLLRLGASYRQIVEWDFDVSAIPTEKVTAEDKLDALKAGMYFVEDESAQTLKLARLRPVLALTLLDPDRPDSHDPYAIWVSPRSMSDMLSLAAGFVDVPAGQISGATKVHIRSSQAKPPFPYRVQHRGYWFYVDDSELESRAFLEAIVAAYSSRVGSRQAGGDAPQTVIAVGGG